MEGGNKKKNQSFGLQLTTAVWDLLKYENVFIRKQRTPFPFSSVGKVQERALAGQLDHCLPLGKKKKVPLEYRAGVEKERTLHKQNKVPRGGGRGQGVNNLEKDEEDCC